MRLGNDCKVCGGQCEGGCCVHLLYGMRDVGHGTALDIGQQYLPNTKPHTLTAEIEEQRHMIASALLAWLQLPTTPHRCLKQHH